MAKAEIARLQSLKEAALGRQLTKREWDRLSELEAKLARQQQEEMPCPFRTNTQYATCTKPGGVCSIRLYSKTSGGIAPVEGDRGRLRALCPWRFHEDSTAFRKVAERLLNDPNAIQAGEVGFLESTGNLDSDPGEDVGRIDMILVKPQRRYESPMDWVAVEVQAVYFSGKNMPLEFSHLQKTQGRLAMPLEKRRPDYRSSGVKRLMPQLQTKVPTLRRWGKKMAVIVDISFFQSMGQMTRVDHVSNADIVWILVDFVEDASGRYRLAVVDEFYTTLESATLGLTGGVPLSQTAFENRVAAKIERQGLSA